MEKDNKKFAYRLRSLDKLLGENYQELERQTIYFAPFSELNDPMEGISDMVWLGDSIVWKNLFKHYLLCMEHKVNLATLYRQEESKKFFKSDFPIFISETNLPTDLYRQHFDAIKERFFSYEIVTALIEYLGARKLPLRKNQLSVILSLISEVALESVLFGHNNSHFQPQSFWDTLRDKVQNVDIHRNLIDALKMADTISEEEIDILMTIVSRTMHQLNLINQCKLGESANKINWLYFISGFLQEYLEQIPQLVYPNWYSASFMSEFPKNSVLWGHYADSHKGACLIFKTDKADNQRDFHISLERPEVDNGEYITTTKLKFKNIIYSDERESEVEFFKRLWIQPAYIVFEEWYSDINGQKSHYISETSPSEEIRLAYWDKLDRIQNTKTKNWCYEHESRISINDSFHNFSKLESRIFKYNFNDLEGIIFGMKTPVSKKVEIITLIAQKCKENKRGDFKFFQSRYDDGNNTIVYDELNLLKFSE